MDLKFWKKALREVERELDAATTRTALDAAAKKLMRAKTELKRLRPKSPPRTELSSYSIAATWPPSLLLLPYFAPLPLKRIRGLSPRFSHTEPDQPE